jgi:hypothetical protein
MATSIIDTPWKTTARLPNLHAAGVRTIIRYYNHANSTKLPEKRVERAEALAIAAAGMGLAVVFQQRQKLIIDFTIDKGRAAGARAVELTASVGQPAGGVIYFGVDSDFVAASELLQIRRFFEGVKELLDSPAPGQPPFIVGAYGSGKVLEHLRTNGLAARFWLAQSTGWSGYNAFKTSGRWHLLQGPETTVGGHPCDTNDANPALPDFGAFTPA